MKLRSDLLDDMDSILMCFFDQMSDPKSLDMELHNPNDQERKFSSQHIRKPR